MSYSQENTNYHHKSLAQIMNKRFINILLLKKRFMNYLNRISRNAEEQEIAQKANRAELAEIVANKAIYDLKVSLEKAKVELENAMNEELGFNFNTIVERKVNVNRLEEGLEIANTIKSELFASE